MTLFFLASQSFNSNEFKINGFKTYEKVRKFNRRQKYLIKVGPGDYVSRTKFKKFKDGKKNREEQIP
jgi:hypothetical protein